MEICGILGLPVAMLPWWVKSNDCNKRKLRVWRVEKCISLVGAKTSLTCGGLQTTPSQVIQYRAENGNLRKTGSNFCHSTVFTPKQCLYQKKATGMDSPKVYSTCRFWKTSLACAGLQTTPSHVIQYRAENRKVAESRVYLLPWYRVCTKGMFISKGSYVYGQS